MSSSSGSQSSGTFESFVQGWLVRQDHYCEELLSVQQRWHESRHDDEDLKELINRVLSHYQEYYAEKSKAAHRNIFQVLSPPWFTSLERAFLWIAGFKPGLLCRIVTNTISDLTDDQRRRIGGLVDETRVEERAMENKLAKVQERIAAPPLLEKARMVGRRWVNGETMVNGETRDDEAAVFESLKARMEALVANADLLRTTTAMKVVEILCPAQNVKFLAAATQFLLQLRSLGLQREMLRE